MKKLYLSNWSYNAALILSELENIIKTRGGRICATWNRSTREQYEIVNRTLLKDTHDTRDKLQRVENLKREAAATACREKLKQLESIDNAPKMLFYGDYLYIRFAIDEKCYYYQLDDNPFFNFYFTKSAIIDNKTNDCCYSNNDNKKWWKDIFYSYNCTPDERRAATEIIFNMLLSAPDSRTYHDKNRKQYKKLYFME